SHAARVQPDQAVANAGSTAPTHIRTRLGEASLSYQPGKLRGALEIRQLEPAGGPCRHQVGVARNDAECVVVAADGDRLDPYRNVVPPLRIALAPDRAFVEGGVNQRPSSALERCAD